MICKNCGNSIPDGSLFCDACGAKQEGSSSANNSNFNSNYNNYGGSSQQQNYYGQNPYTQNPTDDLNQTVNKMNAKNANYLLEGEHVIARAKWTLVPFIILWALWFIYLLIISLGSNRSYYSYSSGMGGFTVLIWIISIAVCAISIFLFLARRELVVTNKKVYGRIGLIGTKQFVIPLSKVNYISVRYNIISRLLNSATFIVYPANAFFGIMFMFVSNGTEFRKAVEEEVYKHSR